jgi:hypothetical protein
MHQRQAAADLLLDTARDWLKAHGMEAMDGPINLGDRNMFWGLLIKNFTDPPIYGTNYNPPYYKDLLEGYGFQLYFNQLFFKRSALVPVQPIFHRKYNQLKNDPDFRMHDARAAAWSRSPRTSARCTTRRGWTMTTSSPWRSHGPEDREGHEARDGPR